MTGTYSYRNEAAWQADVMGTAAKFGWQVSHQLRSIGTRSGLPDLELLHPRSGVAARAELKTANLRASTLAPAQIVMLDLLAQCGVECAVWRPADRDAIDRWLAKPVLFDLPQSWTWDLGSAAQPRLREIRLLQPAELEQLVRVVGPQHGVLYEQRDDTFTPRFT